ACQMRSMRLSARRFFGIVRSRKRSGFRYVTLLPPWRRSSSPQIRGVRIAMTIVMRVAIIAAGIALGSIFGPPAARASGDAPWCLLSQLGEGAQAWDCQYETVQECAPLVNVGNRGSCTPNPYYSPPPATASVPGTGPTNTTPGAVENRK